MLQFLLALGLALLLNQQLRFRGVARVLALVPWAMPPVVVGIMWRLVYHPDAGPLNEFLHRIGADGLRDQLARRLQHRAAGGDRGRRLGRHAADDRRPAGRAAGGAAASCTRRPRWTGPSTWQPVPATSRCPRSRRSIVAITSLDFIWNFNSFGLVYVLTAGGPGGKTMLPMLFAYEEAFRYGNYGYAAALGNVMVVIIVVLLAVYLRRRLREAN